MTKLDRLYELVGHLQSDLDTERVLDPRGEYANYLQDRISGVLGEIEEIETDI